MVVAKDWINAAICNELDLPLALSTTCEIALELEVTPEVLALTWGEQIDLQRN
jgi:hypothetical protein